MRRLVLVAILVACGWAASQLLPNRDAASVVNAKTTYERVVCSEWAQNRVAEFRRLERYKNPDKTAGFQVRPLGCGYGRFEGRTFSFFAYTNQESTIFTETHISWPHDVKPVFVTGDTSWVKRLCDANFRNCDHKRALDEYLAAQDTWLKLDVAEYLEQ